MHLPLFPLHAVLLPGGLMPLRVFETRYLDMIGRCLRENAAFGICLIRSGHDTGAPAEIHTTGVTARLIDWESLEGGLLGVVAQGECKFRVRESHVEKDRLTVADVELLEPEPRLALPEDYAPLADFLKGILAHLTKPYDRVEPQYEDAGWVGGRLTELLPFKPALKQRLLELEDPVARLEQLRLALQTRMFA